MSNDTSNFIDAFDAQERRKRERLPAAKQAILAALRTTRAVRVAIDYDGEGDDGQIGDISAMNAAGKPVKLRGALRLDLHGETRECPTLEEALEAFAWAVLGVYHSGFENNEGGYGTIAIDVAAGTITLDHNDRIIEVCNSVTEV